MKGPTHDLVGASSGVAVGYAAGLSVPATVGLTVASYVGSRLPDSLEGGILPHRGPTHRLWAGLLVAAAAGYGLYRLLTWGALTDLAMAGPRASGIDVRPVLALADDVAIVAAAGVLLGYLMHLVADGCTVHGVDVLGRRVHLLPRRLRIRTGGRREAVLRRALLLGWVLVPVLIVAGCGASRPACDRVQAEQVARSSPGIARALDADVRDLTASARYWPELVIVHAPGTTYSVNVHVTKTCALVGTPQLNPH